MTVVAVFADPPWEGLALSSLAESSPLSEAEAADLYAAMLKDVAVAADRSGGELLVNYRAEEDLPAGVGGDEAAEAAVRATVSEALGGLGDVRFEEQIGSTESARIGNTVTHLLREEGKESVAAVRPTAAFLSRSLVDTAAMKLRRSPVVLGPAPEGRTYFSGFKQPIDFADVYGENELETVTRRARDADLDVDFLRLLPAVERGADLRTALPLLAARRAAERSVPGHTAGFVADLGLVADGGEVVRR